VGVLIRGPEHWFDRYVPPRIMKGSIVEFGTDPETGNPFPGFDVLMIVTDLYTDQQIGGIMAKVAVCPDSNPDHVEYHDIPIEYLELIQQ
jgi:hypothetical protein